MEKEDREGVHGWRSGRHGCPFIMEGGQLWSLKELRKKDKLCEAEGLIQGVYDIMFYMEAVGKEEEIPVSVFIPFKAVLDKALSLVTEVKEDRMEE